MPDGVGLEPSVGEETEDGPTRDQVLEKYSPALGAVADLEKALVDNLIDLEDLGVDKYKFMEMMDKIRRGLNDNLNAKLADFNSVN